MLYSDLLKHQNEEASQLNFEYCESLNQIKQQQEHYDPNKYKEDLQRLDTAFKRDSEALDKLHHQQKNSFHNNMSRNRAKRAIGIWTMPITRA